MSRPNPWMATRPVHEHPIQGALGWALLIAAPVLLWLVWQPLRGWTFPLADFLVFHTGVEVFSVVVALLIFVTGYRAILSSRQTAVVLLGVAFLAVGLFDFLHLLAYEGMPDVLTPNTRQKSIVFWLLARWTAAVALLTYSLLGRQTAMHPSLKPAALVLAMLWVALGAWAGLIHPADLPLLFDERGGLTRLKIGLEWGLVGVNLLTLLVLWHHRQRLAQECLMALAFAVALSSVSEMFFTLLGLRDKDGANALGHLYKVAAYLYLFHATVNEALRRPLELLATQTQREKLILSAAPDGVLWVDSHGQISVANPAIETLTGYASSELVGQPVDVLLPEAMRAGHGDAMRRFFLAPSARAMGSMNLRLRCKDGHLLPVDISLGHFSDGQESAAIAYIRDLSERVAFEETLRQQALTDDLTGLPNRRQFRQRLAVALDAADSHSRPFAVLLLDLDHFKDVNDSFGHATGDDLLVMAGARIRGLLKPSDLLARMGGDEFACLLLDLTDRAEAEALARRLLEALQGAYRLQQQDVYSGASIGLALFPHDSDDLDALLRYADIAMYQAKLAGRGSYACYSPELDRRAHEAMQLHARLKEALDLGHLRLHYQPQVDVVDGTVLGAEALLRWQDPVLGEISPARFIPVAEATGLILPLSEWVLETACRQIAEWTREGQPLRVAVNFSALQFRQGDLPQRIAQVLERTGAQAHWLEIEITESVAMAQPEKAQEHIAEFARMGCRVVLDDFGTGYSSLAYLKTLKVSKLKIDRSFMRGIPEQPEDVTISDAIIGLAHSLGMTLVAEGVETPEQLGFLREARCEAFQGWLFAKALDPAALTQIRNRGRWEPPPAATDPH